MDVQRVTAAVKIKIQIQRNNKRQESLLEKQKQLRTDLNRLEQSMTAEEYNEFLKRTA